MAGSYVDGTYELFDKSVELMKGINEPKIGDIVYLFSIPSIHYNKDEIISLINETSLDEKEKNKLGDKVKDIWENINKYEFQKVLNKENSKSRIGLIKNELDERCKDEKVDAFPFYQKFFNYLKEIIDNRNSDKKIDEIRSDFTYLRFITNERIVCLMHLADPKKVPLINFDNEKYVKKHEIDPSFFKNPNTYADDFKSLVEKINEIKDKIKKDDKVEGDYSNYFINRYSFELSDIEKQIDNLIKQGKKQIVLTGAPGTGKTYSARNYANKFKTGEMRFIQFHPSLDYSDFVEGLRPINDSSENSKFVKLDGVFKKFCRYVVKKNLNAIGINDSKYDQKGERENENKTKDDEKNNQKISFFDDYKEVENDKKHYIPPYFFIIDEINRADLSKVFGELMYCLEDSYRGLYDGLGNKNLVDTQYQTLDTYFRESDNISKNEFDCFSQGFFIPKNVIIIGTMNDIDRSVESFDFALRRRFSWINIKANDILKEAFNNMFDAKKINDFDKFVEFVKNVNMKISDPNNAFGLNENYHLGPAYFKKYDGSFDSLKDIYLNNVEPILIEYTRGRRIEDIEENLLKPVIKEFLKFKKDGNYDDEESYIKLKEAL